MPRKSLAYRSQNWTGTPTAKCPRRISRTRPGSTSTSAIAAMCPKAINVAREPRDTFYRDAALTQPVEATLEGSAMLTSQTGSVRQDSRVTVLSAPLTSITKFSGPANRMNLAVYPSTCFVAKRSDIEGSRL
jgi:hypothetical protein